MGASTPSRCLIDLAINVFKHLDENWQRGFEYVDVSLVVIAVPNSDALFALVENFINRFTPGAYRANKFWVFVILH